MKEIKEIGFSFPESTKYITREKGLKITVKQGAVCVEYANTRDLARAGLIVKANGTDSDYVIEENNTFEDVCLMVDCSRNAVRNIQTVKKLIRNLAMIGYTSLSHKDIP